MKSILVPPAIGKGRGGCSSCMQLRWFCSYLAKIGLAWYSCHCNKKGRRIIFISCSSAWPHVETISFHFFAIRRNSMFMIAILVVKISISAYTWHWENSSMQWQCIRTCWMRKTRGQNCTFRGTIAENCISASHLPLGREVGKAIPTCIGACWTWNCAN